MRLWLLLAALAGCFPALSATGQPRPLRPDLVVSEASVTPQRVGVGEEFTYTVTVKNIGGAPCNWINFQLFGADDLSELVRVIPELGINCDREICSGGFAFLLWPGQSVQAKYVQKARTPGLHKAATATVDQSRACSEASETNNTATTPTVQIIERPKLSVSATRPRPSNIEQTLEFYTATITNVGRGVATDVALAFPQSIGFLPIETPAAHFGPRPAAGSPDTPALPVACQTTPNGGTKICTVAVRLGPNDSFRAFIKSEACHVRRHSQPLAVSTADDISTDNHTVVLQRSCTTG